MKFKRLREFTTDQRIWATMALLIHQRTYVEELVEVFGQRARIRPCDCYEQAQHDLITAMERNVSPR